MTRLGYQIPNFTYPAPHGENPFRSVVEQAKPDEAMLECYTTLAAIAQQLKHILIFGDPDTVGEQLTAAMRTGIDGMTINLPVNGHHTERVRLLGEIASQAITEANGRTDA